MEGTSAAAAGPPLPQPVCKKEGGPTKVVVMCHDRPALRRGEEGGGRARAPRHALPRRWPARPFSSRPREPAEGGGAVAGAVAAVAAAPPLWGACRLLPGRRPVGPECGGKEGRSWDREAYAAAQQMNESQTGLGQMLENHAQKINGLFAINASQAKNT